MSALVLAAFLLACATTHVNTAVPLAQTSVQGSCSYRPDIQIESASVIACVMENTGRDWQDLVIRSVRYPDQQDVTIVSPPDLQTLVEAYRQKKKRSDSNTDLVLGGLTMGGMMVAGFGGDQATRNAGRVAAIGGTAGMIGKEAHKEYSEAQYGSGGYGEQHLLSGNLRIPPDLSMRRQIVINNPSKKPKTMEICWDQPKDVCTVLEL